MTFLVVKHVDCEGLGLWEKFCQEEGVALEVVELHRGGELPRDGQFHAVVILGGPMNVYEEEAHPFLRGEDAFIRQALSQSVPFLGICLGGQLLAKALGGRVVRNPVKEIGWHGIELDQQGQRDPLFAGLPDRFTVFQWHGDTFSLPNGTSRLARSQACENQAFRYGFGGIAYALQFHLEVTPPMIGQWAREYAGELAEAVEPAEAARMLEQAPARCEQLHPLSRRVFQNFCHLVQLRHTGVACAPTGGQQEGERRAPARDAAVERAWQGYRELIARGKLRCGVTCPLDRIGHCTGGCW